MPEKLPKRLWAQFPLRIGWHFCGVHRRRVAILRVRVPGGHGVAKVVRHLHIEVLLPQSNTGTVAVASGPFSYRRATFMVPLPQHVACRMATFEQ